MDIKAKFRRKFRRHEEIAAAFTYGELEYLNRAVSSRRICEPNDMPVLADKLHLLLASATNRRLLNIHD